MPEISLDKIAERIVNMEIPPKEKLRSEPEEKAQQSRLLKAAKSITQTAETAQKQRVSWERRGLIPTPTPVLGQAPLKLELEQRNLPGLEAKTAVTPLSDEEFDDIVVKEEKKKSRSLWRKFTDFMGTPVKVIFNAFKIYNEKVVQPLVGLTRFIGHEVSPFNLPGEPSYWEAYNESRQKNGLWQSFGDAWRGTKMNWFLKMGVEIAHDPLMYIPFAPALKIPGVAGKVYTRVVVGMNDAMDLPFKLGIKAIKQSSEAVQASRFGSSFYAITHTKIGVRNASFADGAALAQKILKGKGISEGTVADADKLRNVLRKNLEPATVYKPRGDFSSPYIDFMEHTSTVGKWDSQEFKVFAKEIKSSVEPDIIVSNALDDLRVQRLTGRIGDDAVADQATRILQVPFNDANKKKVLSFIGSHNKRVSSLIDSTEGLNMMQTLDKMTNAVAARAAKTAFSAKEAQRLEQWGQVIGSRLNRAERNWQKRINATVYRWVIAPTAEANLGFAGYFIGNAPEEVLRSLLASHQWPNRGIFGDPVEKLRRQIKGVEDLVPYDLQSGESRLGLAAEIGAAGTERERAGAFSLLPSGPTIKIGSKRITPLKWITKDPIHASNVSSTGIRRQNYTALLNKQLALEMDTLSKTGVGVDSNLLRNFIEANKLPPKVSAELEELVDELQKNSYHYVFGGNPQYISNQKKYLTQASIQQKRLAEIVNSHVDIPWGIRADLIDAISKGGTREELLAKLGGIPKAEAALPPTMEAKVASVAETSPEVLKYSHTIKDIEAIASGEGIVKVYHGAPSEFADMLTTQGPKVPYKVEDVAKKVAKTYGLNWQEFKPYAYRAHEVVEKLSTAPAPVASRWAQFFPQGEILSDLNSQARLLVRAKQIKKPRELLEDAYERLSKEAAVLIHEQPAGAGYVADMLNLPDKYALKSKVGALVELEIDVSALPNQAITKARLDLDMLRRAEVGEKELVELWNHQYVDFKISPDAIKSARIVVRDIPMSPLITPKPIPKAEPGVKEPWQMTYEQLARATAGAKPEAQRELIGRMVWKDLQATGWEPAIGKEYLPGAKIPTFRLSQAHRNSIQLALSKGKSVPPEVLKDYPDLAASAIPKAEATVAGGAKELLHKYAFAYPEYVRGSMKNILDWMKGTPVNTVDDLAGLTEIMSQVGHTQAAIESNVYKLAAKARAMFPEQREAIWKEADDIILKHHEEVTPLLDEMKNFLDESSKKFPQAAQSSKLLIADYDELFGMGRLAREKAIAKKHEFFKDYPNRKEMPRWEELLDSDYVGPVWDEYRTNAAEVAGRIAAHTRQLGRVIGYTPKALPTEPILFRPDTFTKEAAAKIFGDSPSGLVRAVYEHQTIVGKKDFVAQFQGHLKNILIEEGEHINTPLYQGINAQMIGKVYDDILAEIGLPEQMHTLLTPFENNLKEMRIELEHALIAPKANDSEIAALHSWLDNVAEAGKAVKTQSSPERLSAIAEARQRAMLKTKELMEKHFVQYGDPTIWDYAMKQIFPYFTYESQRFPWLIRMGVNYPGMFVGVPSRWGDYTDMGYAPLALGLEWNPTRGTIFGAGRRLMLQDYPDYYSGPAHEIMDGIGRWGFYPNVAIMGGVAALGWLEEGKPDYGGLLPVFPSTVLDAGIAMGIPGVAETREILFPDRFREYMKDQLMTKNYKMNLDDVNDALADPNIDPTKKKILEGMVAKVDKELALYNMLISQISFLRLYPEERRAYWENYKKAIESMTGLTVEQQENLRRRGVSVRDVVLLSPEQTRVLNYLEFSEWRGITSSLRPVAEQRVMELQDNYWEDVDELQRKRYQEQLTDDYLYTSGQISKGLFAQNRDERWEKYINQTNDLKELKYEGLPTTWEDSAKLLKENGIYTTLPHPIRMLLDGYYALPMPTYPDGTYNYDQHTINQYQYLKKIPLVYRKEVITELLRNRTPLEQQEFATKFGIDLKQLGITEIAGGLAAKRAQAAGATVEKYGMAPELMNLEPKLPVEEQIGQKNINEEQLTSSFTNALTKLRS